MPNILLAYSYTLIRYIYFTIDGFIYKPITLVLLVINMSFVNAKEMGNIGKKANVFVSDTIAPIAGFLGGIVAPDFLGIEAITDYVFEAVGITAFLPTGITNIKFAGLIAAAAYGALAAVMGKFFGSKGLMRGISKGMAGYFGGSALRLGFESVIGSIQSIQATVSA